MAIMITLIPPIHWVRLRQNKIPRGRDSTSLKMVADVVVKPETDSKKASVKLPAVEVSR